MWINPTDSALAALYLQVLSRGRLLQGTTRLRAESWLTQKETRKHEVYDTTYTNVTRGPIPHLFIHTRFDDGPADVVCLLSTGPLQCQSRE